MDNIYIVYIGLMTCLIGGALVGGLCKEAGMSDKKIAELRKQIQDEQKKVL